MKHAHIYAMLSIWVSVPALKAGLNVGPWAQGRKADLLQAPDLARGCHTWAGWRRSSNRPVLMLSDVRMHWQRSTIIGPVTQHGQPQAQAGSHHGRLSLLASSTLKPKDRRPRSCNNTSE